VADPEKVERVAIQYMDGWADYDDGGGCGISSKSGGDGWRKDLVQSKSLKEALPSHNAADGRHY
jgi:hypothetical protein